MDRAVNRARTPEFISDAWAKKVRGKFRGQNPCDYSIKKPPDPGMEPKAFVEPNPSSES